MNACYIPNILISIILLNPTNNPLGFLEFKETLGPEKVNKQLVYGHKRGKAGPGYRFKSAGLQTCHPFTILHNLLL